MATNTADRKTLQMIGIIKYVMTVREKIEIINKLPLVASIDTVVAVNTEKTLKKVKTRMADAVDAICDVLDMMNGNRLVN